MQIEKILNNNRLLAATIGIGKKEFEELLKTFTKILEEERTNHKRERKVGGGRNGNIKSAQNKLFFILFYLKTYPTYDVAAYIFASSKTRTHIWVKEILPLLEKTLKRKIVLPQRQIGSVEEFLKLFPEVKEVLIDGVERPINRSKKVKVQNKHYSGKKKRHTRKNLIMTDTKKKVLVISPTKHGRVHDKKMSDKFSFVTNLPENVTAIVDTGFIGIAKQHGNTFIPKKKSKSNPITEMDKQFNKLISACRIPVEHAIGSMKNWKIFKDIMRNKHGIDDYFTFLVAGLHNFKLEMRATG